MFIAEVSSNHGADLTRSLEFVRAARDVGADAIKFQLFRIDDLFSPEAIAANPDIARRRAWELPVEFIPELAAAARAAGLKFGCTPFWLGAVDLLRPHVDFLKIASYELLWLDLVKACARTGLPTIISSGIATLGEAEQAAKTYRAEGGVGLEMMHCVSSYPAPAEQVNLAAIATLRSACACPVGWSDHTHDPAVIQRAVHHHGATLVEFHFDLDGQGAEFGPGHCWLPAEATALIAGIRRGMSADGNGLKHPVSAEMDERLWRADPSDGLRPLLSKREELRLGMAAKAAGAS